MTLSVQPPLSQLGTVLQTGTERTRAIEANRGAPYVSVPGTTTNLTTVGTWVTVGTLAFTCAERGLVLASASAYFKQVTAGFNSSCAMQMLLDGVGAQQFAYAASDSLQDATPTLTGGMLLYSGLSAFSAHTLTLQAEKSWDGSSAVTWQCYNVMLSTFNLD